MRAVVWRHLNSIVIVLKKPPAWKFGNGKASFILRFDSKTIQQFTDGMSIAITRTLPL